MKQTRRHRLALLALSVPLAASLAACSSGGGSGDSTAGGSAAARDSVAAPAPNAPAGSSTGYGSAKAASATDTVLGRAVIATGELSLTTPHLTQVRQDALDLVTGLGGHVADEQSQSDSRGRPDRVDLTLRVPATTFEHALDGLSALGTVRHRQQTVEDVTTQVIDTDARVKAQAASVASIQRLLARARTIGEIMSIESQLSRRQADLDSLTQQQKWLSDQTSMSTIQLSLTRPAAVPATAAHAGFVGGLRDGWHALGRTAVAVGTALGAVLPFAVVLALIGIPGWALYRRRRVPAPAQEA